MTTRFILTWRLPTEMEYHIQVFQDYSSREEFKIGLRIMKIIDIKEYEA